MSETVAPIGFLLGSGAVRQPFPIVQRVQDGAYLTESSPPRWFEPGVPKGCRVAYLRYPGVDVAIAQVVIGPAESVLSIPTFTEAVA